ncbi:hypothetical protein [Tychonema sp. BBK16]|uniref:hypothetical protein n=1 Tax=Tychonema sp. BBK16 TaxID=2699888 RepID=UPI0038D26082
MSNRLANCQELFYKKLHFRAIPYGIASLHDVSAIDPKKSKQVLLLIGLYPKIY